MATIRATIPLLFALVAYYYNNVFSAVMAVVVVVVVVGAARIAMVAWIAVLVMLTFVGNRRRVLVRERRKITAEVGRYLLKVVISERKGAFTTFACAAAFSLLASYGWSC